MFRTHKHLQHRCTLVWTGTSQVNTTALSPPTLQQSVLQSFCMPAANYQVSHCAAGPRANKTGITPKKTSALTDLRSISPSVVRRKANAALMSAVDSSTPRIKRAGLLKPLNVSILDKENNVSAATSILLPFTPNANKVALSS